MSIWSKCSFAPLIAAMAPAKVSRSAMTAIASAPAASASCRTSSTNGARSTNASLPPSPAMRRATVRPMPCAAPVTTTALPVKRPAKIISFSAALGSDVVDVDDMVDVVVLQNDLFARDQRLRAGRVERVEGCAEVSVHGLVAVAESHPVEPHLADAVRLLDDLNGADAEDPILEPAPAAVPDQRNFRLRVGDELIVVVPGWHPELHVGGIEREPVVPFLVIEKARLAVQELPHILERELRGGIRFFVCGRHRASP